MSPQRKRSRRGLLLESLEGRMLLASDSFHNFLSPHDVNDDSRVSAADALLVINHLTHDNFSDDDYFEDVNDDGKVTARDALKVINGLSQERPGSVTDEAIARLYRNDGVRVKLELETEDSGMKLEIKVQNAPPNETFEVRIDDVSIGQLTTNSRGRGELEFGSDDDELPIPADLPPIQAGTVAEIVGLGESQFASSSSFSSSDDDSSSDNIVTAGDTFELKTQLTGIASIDAKVKYESTEDNVEFKAELRDAPANTTYSVVVDSVTVGSLQTDSQGRGRLQFELSDNSKPFPANFPSVEVGTVVQIGDVLSGAFRLDDQSPSDSTDDSNDGDSTSDSSTVTAGDTFELKTQLTGIASIDAAAKYESTADNVEFKAELRGAPANTTYSVVVDGVNVGSLQTDSQGEGRLHFELNDNSKPFPANFPSVDVGTVVQIGDVLSGAFRLDDNTPSDSNDDDSTSNTTVTAGGTFELKAELQGIASVDAEADYESTTSNVEFKVELKNAPSNTTYTVVVGGVAVGTLRTDSRGRGRLQFELNDDSKPFPANFPSVEAGMEIRVGDQLVGNFSLDSNDD